MNYIPNIHLPTATIFLKTYIKNNVNVRAYIEQKYTSQLSV